MSKLPASRPNSQEALNQLTKDPPFWLWGAAVAFLVVFLQLMFIYHYAVEGFLFQLVTVSLLGALAGQIGGKLGGGTFAIILATVISLVAPICLVIATYYYASRYGGLY